MMTEDELDAALRSSHERNRRMLLAKVVFLINDYGGTPGSSLHSWRCEDKDRYPEACTCVEELADDILKTIPVRY